MSNYRTGIGGVDRRGPRLRQRRPGQLPALIGDQVGERISSAHLPGQPATTRNETP